MTAPATVPDLLRRAAQVLDERGWQHTAGWYVDNCGHVCALGAMYVALGAEPRTEDNRVDYWWPPVGSLASKLHSNAWRALDDYLGIFTPTWNDDPTRTVDEVKAALLAAADGYDPEGGA